MKAVLLFLIAMVAVEATAKEPPPILFRVSNRNKSVILLAALECNFGPNNTSFVFLGKIDPRSTSSIVVLPATADILTVHGISDGKEINVKAGVTSVITKNGLVEIDVTRPEQGIVAVPIEALDRSKIILTQTDVCPSLFFDPAFSKCTSSSTPGRGENQPTEVALKEVKDRDVLTAILFREGYKYGCFSASIDRPSVRWDVVLRINERYWYGYSKPIDEVKSFDQPDPDQALKAKVYSAFSDGFGMGYELARGKK